jgi:glycerol-3-phosphate acyltransferase PlsY
MNFGEIIYLISAYLFGAIPTGYLIARATAGKNILQIGWRKNSGSNVFYNVGKWQGIATIVIDFLKGYLVVFAAMVLGLPVFVQALAALAALVGHNWSVFLRFAGGRGIAIYGGALLAFSPQVFGATVLAALVFFVLVTSSVATLVGLAAAAYFSRFFGAIPGVGIFTVYSVIPILLKRLSPYRELPLINPKIILNRLLFDDDVVPKMGISGFANYIKITSGVDKNK